MAPGFNPKDTAETYVDKIMTNRKRIEYTIARYEEEQKKKLGSALGKDVEVPSTATTDNLT